MTGRRLVLIACAAAALCTAAAGSARTQRAALNPVATGILEGIGEKAAGVALGEVLHSVGYQDPTQQQLADISAKLDRISAQLASLRASVESAHAAVVRADCRNQSIHAQNIVGEVNSMFDRMVGLAESNETAEQKKATADEITKDIGADLLGKQQTLHKLIAGDTSFSAGLLGTCARAFEFDTRPFLTHAQQSRIYPLADYYVDQEALLLALRVNYWRVKKQTDAYVNERIAEAKNWITGSDSPLHHLRARPPQGTFIDKRHRRMWEQHVVLLTWPEVEQRFGGKFSGLTGPGGYGPTWAFPTATEAFYLLHGWNGIDAWGWLRSTAGVTAPSSTNCIWTESSKIGAFHGRTVLNALTGGYAVVPSTHRCYVILTRDAGGLATSASYGD